MEQPIYALRSSWSGQVVAIDGKTVRGAGQTESGMPQLHSVSARAADARLSLAQIKTQDKSNEITAIPYLLDLIDISGCIVTSDAMGCQKEIAKAIVRKKADYVLAFVHGQKDPALYESYIASTASAFTSMGFPVVETIVGAGLDAPGMAGTDKALKEKAYAAGKALAGKQA